MVGQDFTRIKTEDNLFPLKKTLHIRGKLYYLDEPWVMGIVNTTPDSFYKGSRSFKNAKTALAKASQMAVEGAKIVDVGGYSSRPNASDISEIEELNRVIPVISIIKKELPDLLISIDTFRHQVAKEAVLAGADMVNDISGGQLDGEMIRSVGRLGVPYICMHMRGNPHTMQQLTDYDHLETSIARYFSSKIAECKKAGIKDVVLDLGFGFAKTLEQNYQLLRKLPYFKSLYGLMLVGISRKSMIYKLLGGSPEEALNGTTALNMAALMGGAQLLRVHDVKETIETIKIHKQLYT